jgi:hypothetical protein
LLEFICVTSDFLDNLIIFATADNPTIQVIIKVLDEFQLLSGFAASTSKSEITLLGQVR